MNQFVKSFHTTDNQSFSVVMRGISKRFGNVIANYDVSLEVRRGEIHGLLGENGAGKTVLMSILAGIHRPDSGEIYLNGNKVFIDSPLTAIKYGIGMVHQHFMLIQDLSVLENIILGSEPTSYNGLLINYRKAEEIVRKLMEKYRLYVNLNEVVNRLPIGLQQRVEILKVLYRQAEILILDEPTTVLTPEEVKNLFSIIESFKASGKTVIFITHKLNEATGICDRITILRRGKVIGTVDAKQVSHNLLAEMMIGGKPVEARVRKSKNLCVPLLELYNVTVYNEYNKKILDNVNLTIYSGEILGLAGVEGNGQKELIETIVGLRQPISGRILMNGVHITNSPINVRRELGLCYIPEDRSKALIQDFSVVENLILGTHNKPPYSILGMLRKHKLEKYAEELINKYDIRVSCVHTEVKTLSGGNQQKVVLAREFTRTPQVVLAAHPTRGLDIAAMEFVRNRLIEMRNYGTGVLLISADLDEIFEISDRVAVIYEGKILAQKPITEVNKNEIGLLMGGGEILGSKEVP